MKAKVWVATLACLVAAPMAMADLEDVHGDSSGDGEGTESCSGVNKPVYFAGPTGARFSDPVPYVSVPTVPLHDDRSGWAINLMYGESAYFQFIRTHSGEGDAEEIEYRMTGTTTQIKCDARAPSTCLEAAPVGVDAVDQWAQSIVEFLSGSDSPAPATSPCETGTLADALEAQ